MVFLPVTDHVDFTIELALLDLKAGDGMVEEASRLLMRAESLAKLNDYSGAIEAAQHSIELSVKSLYRLVGLKPPRTHLERIRKKEFGEENPLELVAERLQGIDESDDLARQDKLDRKDVGVGPRYLTLRLPESSRKQTL